MSRFGFKEAWNSTKPAVTDYLQTGRLIGFSNNFSCQMAELKEWCRGLSRPFSRGARRLETLRQFERSISSRSLVLLAFSSTAFAEMSQTDVKRQLLAPVPHCV
jgi:hypothetical protein